MSRFSKLKAPFIYAGIGFFAVVLAGCGGGGGGGGGGGSSSPSGTPSPYDGTYAGTAVPTEVLASDGQAPTSSLVVTRGRGTAQFTYYLQPSVVSAVQTALDKGLRDGGYPGDIPNNQVPLSIKFNATGAVDGSGKLVLTQRLTSRANVSLCGSATLTVDPTFTANGTSIKGQGNYSVQFADHFTLRIKGTNQDVPSDRGSCNNLPLRTGTVSYTK